MNITQKNNSVDISDKCILITHPIEFGDDLVDYTMFMFEYFTI